MADQEFSSPGAHMASQSINAVSGGVAYRYPNKGHTSSNVIYAPPVDYSSINNSYNDYLDERDEYGSARDYSDRAYDFNRRYMDYNSELFNSAKDYDMYMSNTAIQRQVQDLIKAGLNPILAANLGGAIYKGVNAPYISISPGSALQAYTGYDASIYGSDLSYKSNIDRVKIETASQEFINSYNKIFEDVWHKDNIQLQKDLVSLKRDADEYLESIKHLNDVELQKFGFKNQKVLSDYKYELDEKFYIFRNYGDGEYNRKSLDLVDYIGRLLPFTSGILSR